MKRSKYFVIALAALVCMNGCGKKDNVDTNTEESTVLSVVESNAETSVAEQNETTENKKSDTEKIEEELSIYPGCTEIAEIPMGITSEVVTIKMPLNYVIAGNYLDENGTSVILDGLDSATTTVQDGINAGSFYQDNKMVYATWTSAEFEGTTISAEVYGENMAITFDDVKTYYPDGKEFGTSDIPAWLYHQDNELENIDFSVCMQISPEIILNLDYTGPLDDEIGEEAAAQQLYDLGTVK